jgi:simple sugar transport system permease protein
MNSKSTNKSNFFKITIENIKRPEISALFAFIVVFIIFSIFGWDKNFVSLIGASTWINYAASVGLIAFPVGFLMIAGELDISVGAVLPASAMTLGILSGYYELPTWLGLILTLGMAFLVGLINGLIVTRTQVPSLIVTLATLFAVGGLTLTLAILFTDSTLVAYYAPDWAKYLFGTVYYGGFRSIVFWWLALTLIFFLFLHKSPWGNWVFATGGDLESARNAGIPTARLKIALFILCSVCTALAGICQVIQFNSAQSATNFALIFNTIISVVVGGVLLTGGFGTLIGIFFGTLTLAIVQQGINFTNIDRNLSNLIIGIMLLFAVFVNGSFQSLTSKVITSDGDDKDEKS